MEILKEYEGVNEVKNVEFMVECLIEDINVSKGSKYEVYQEDEKNYWIKENKHGTSSFYPKHWFVKILEEKKELNIIEASNMPIGTEFKIVYQNGNIDGWRCKVTEGSSKKLLSWTPNDNSIGGTQDIINAKFIVIEKQKPVPFQEVIDKDCILCRVEHEHVNSWLSYESLQKTKEYLKFNQLMGLLSELPSDELKIVLKYGRWYIKEIGKSC